MPKIFIKQFYRMFLYTKWNNSSLRIQNVQLQISIQIFREVRSLKYYSNISNFPRKIISKKSEQQKEEENQST